MRDARFTALFGAHYAAVLRYARRRTTPSEAHDIASEAFVVAWRRLDDVPPETALPWLYGVARRIMANRRRGDERRGRLLSRLVSFLEARGTEREPARPDVAPILRALSHLSATDQELLRLVAWEGLSHSQIGVVLGCSPANVAARLHRARQRLRGQLSNRPMQQPADAEHMGERRQVALPFEKEQP
jgi:RNA polymerase sigma-70 factor (ECF subfamily)